MKIEPNNIYLGVGLRIKTVTGKTFMKMGTVEYKSEYNCFYCGGESFPAEIVCAIITEDTEKHRADVAEEALSLAFDEWTCCDLCMFSFDCKTNRTDCKKAEISKIKQKAAEQRLKELQGEVE